MQTRLNKFIANHTEYSRRQVDAFITEGKVMVDDEVVTQLGTKIEDSVNVKLNGKVITTDVTLLYVLLNKPKGYVVTKQDRHATRTVMQLLPQSMQHLNPIGRLDKQSTGVLLFTNDGETIQRYTHPKFQKEKEYLVYIKHPITPHDLQQLQTGIELEEGNTGKVFIKKVNDHCLRIILRQGWNRQIRRMIEAIDNRVTDLQRIRVGKIGLGALPLGKWQVLTSEEIKEL